MQTIIKLSKTSKMPCQSFSLPAQACKTGSKLAQVKGSVCHGCYALKGFYKMPTVKKPRQANLDSLPTNGNWSPWIEHMVSSIKGNHFRWHDSGDIQSTEHLSAICTIAALMPSVKFWLPTKEFKIVREYVAIHGTPDNLIIRVSSPMVDQKPLKGYQFTSTVHDKQEPVGHVCNAPSQGGKCKDCRACWDKSISNVSYAKH